MEIRPLNPDEWRRYETISIASEVTDRVVVETIAEGRFETVPITPRHKDYDEDGENRPSTYPERFETRHWGFLIGLDPEPVCGSILAYRCPEFDLLEGRDDLVHVVDFRVATPRRGQGVGRLLWAAIEAWARERMAGEIRVETQDVNVAACRFYSAMGCRLHSATPDAYGPDLDETMLIWSLRLR